VRSSFAPIDGGEEGFEGTVSLCVLSARRQPESVDAHQPGDPMLGVSPPQ